MKFSISTIAVVASMLASPLAVTASPIEIEERGLLSLLTSSSSLCNKAHYGATGYPWQTSSTPGSWCGGSKPGNNKAWKNLPTWDGGDSIKCSSTLFKYLNICKSGDKGYLPKGCNPPHKGRGKTSTIKSSTSSAAVVTPSANATTVVTETTAAPSPSATTSIVDPISDPVCESTYQVQYLNYTIVAPNGVWSGLTVGAATQDASYMTYTLSDSVDGCLKACDNIEGCVFVNTYYDENDTETDLPKHTPGVLTCAMFSQCVGTEQNDNFGGQDDPNIIIQSNGYCKSGACN